MREFSTGATEYRSILAKAISKWGAQAQTLMVMEEMSELQKELCKHARGRHNADAIAEEIADVLIMLEQMIVLHNCETAVNRHRRMKLERLDERIREDGSS